MSNDGISLPALSQADEGAGGNGRGAEQDVADAAIAITHADAKATEPAAPAKAEYNALAKAAQKLLQKSAPPAMETPPPAPPAPPADTPGSATADADAEAAPKSGEATSTVSARL